MVYTDREVYGAVGSKVTLHCSFWSSEWVSDDISFTWRYQPEGGRDAISVSAGVGLEGAILGPHNGTPEKGTWAKEGEIHQEPQPQLWQSQCRSWSPPQPKTPVLRLELRASLIPHRSSTTPRGNPTSTRWAPSKSASSGWGTPAGRTAPLSYTTWTTVTTALSPVTSKTHPT